MYGGQVRELYAGAGLGNRIGYGRSPAVVVVDLQAGFTDPGKSPLAGDLEAPIEATNRLIRAARGKQVPIIWTVIAYEDEGCRDGGLWIVKAPNMKSFKRGSGLDALDPRLDASPGDLVIVKKFASGFFGTPLASTLVFLGVDTLIVAGCTTSGCVRATVVDGFQHGFRVIVPGEATGDRATGPHEAALFDMNSKYADVVKLEEVLAYLESLQGKV